MKRLLQIQPRYVIAITVVVALLMFTSAIVELRQSRKELVHLMTEEATSLIEAITQSSINTILSSREIEQLLAERLLNNAYLIAQLDSATTLTSEHLAQFAAANNIFRINLFNRRGEKVLSSYAPHTEHAGLPEKYEPKDYFQPILDGKVDQLIIGLKEARFEPGQRYAVAVKRRRAGGGAIVLNLDAKYFLDFRKRIGIGKLLQDLGDNSGVEYIALQDEEGIIAASKGVEELGQILGDEFLERALQSDSAFTRVAAFKDKEVFEVVKTLRVLGEHQGLFRLGLSMDEMHALEARMRRRLLIMSLMLITIGAVVMTFILVNQNLQTVSHEYQRIKTYTGEILQNMADAVITIDREQTITLFNKSAENIFGMAAEKVVGKKHSAIFGNQSVLLDSLLSRQPRKNVEVPYDLGDNNPRLLSISTSLTFDAQGEVEAATAVIKDLTEVRRMEEEMRRREKLSAMGELASGVAHEIRNPLNAISMIAQRYEKEFQPQKGLQEYQSLTKVLKSEVQRVNNIIQQFLRFARPPQVHLSRLALQDFLSQIATLFEGQARAKGVHFTTSSDCDLELLIDREQMTQAILNVLQNALEATPRGGTITLACTTNKKEMTISVQDTGSGIPKDHLDKIFNLYYTTKPNGTGMGLAITQQIVSQHQGTIEVQSEEGKGTQFLIRLPVTRLSSRNQKAE
ncbi:MAG: ATP-binding protein [candidate division KSB1 bacterium]|nr:ATP-binding protein [candidate division KSB1 bacterium]MDZ7302616.1 ATP-binding protein [candidate division KSB1 bacterium]MDZ7311544.1 ATP-binding protein [candidate division KSB1 bacterium]